MTEIQRHDEEKPKYEKPVVIDLGEPLTGLGIGLDCNYGTTATATCTTGGQYNRN